MITWIINIFLSFFFLLDQIVYGLIESLYQMILQIANISVISQASMQEFANRIYVLVGVVMLFKVAFSLIQLFANPDKMSDSKIGAGSLVKRIITSLVLLVMAPTIFQLAFRIQGTILNAGILEKVILDSDVAPDGQNPIDVDCSLEENQAYRVCGGRTIAFAIFRGFVTPNENLYEENENGEQVLSSDYADYEENVEQYNEAVKEQNIGKLLDPILAGESGDRPFNYSFLISTIAGGFAAWLLFIFCFDVAIRAVKLTFLQLLAPIPILSYVDTSKGTDIFKNWVSACISAYLEIFIRLIALYFVVYIIAEISKDGLFSFYEYTAEGATKQAEDVGLLATAFIVLGLLMFANQAPKLIMEIFNIKGSGDFTLNPLKKIGQSPLATAAVGTTGLALGFAGRQLQNAAVRRKLKEKRKKGETLSSEEQKQLERASGWRGFMGSVGAGVTTTFGAWGNTMKGQGKNNAFAPVGHAVKRSAQKHERRENLRNQGKSPYREEARENLYRYFNVKNEYGGIGELNEEIKKLKNSMADLSGMESRSRERQTDSLMDFISKYSQHASNPEGLAEAMDKAFKRDKDGKFIESDTARANIINDIQVNMTNQGLDAHEAISAFETYASYESTHNYYNQEHEKVKKQIGRMEAAATAPSSDNK